MIVKLIAHTTIMDVDAMYDAGWTPPPSQETEMFGMQQPRWMDQLPEFAGRLCYQSWDRPNSKTRANCDYLNHIIDVEHFSVLEHASATFYVAAVSRSLSHELVRHRHLSFSQLSQRYVDESNTTFVTPPAIIELALKLKAQDDVVDSQGFADAFVAHLTSASEAALNSYEELYTRLERSGLTRKQAREAARCVLPNATETRFVVTGNSVSPALFSHMTL